MPTWVWITLLCSIAFVGLLFLIRVRYRLDWDGGSKWSAALEFGVPGFMRGLTFPTETASTSETDSAAKTSEPTQASKTSTPKKKSRSNRKFGSRIGWILLKDTVLLRALLRFGLRFVRMIFGLLNLELDCAIGYPDPAKLGRFAGYWYAVQPFLGRRIRLQFRFQDTSSSLQLRLRGGFSAARALSSGVALLASFPWVLLLRRFWRARRLAKLSVG